MIRSCVLVAYILRSCDARYVTSVRASRQQVQTTLMRTISVAYKLRLYAWHQVTIVRQRGVLFDRCTVTYADDVRRWYNVRVHQAACADRGVLHGSWSRLRSARTHRQTTAWSKKSARQSACLSLRYPSGTVRRRTRHWTWAVLLAPDHGKPITFSYSQCDNLVLFSWYTNFAMRYIGER